MRTDTPLMVVLLAAGQQERFGDTGTPKCLSQIGSVTIFERIRQKYKNWPIVTVIHNGWEEAYRKAIGYPHEAVLVDQGCTMGHSLSAGIRAAVRAQSGLGQALVLDADTYIPKDKPLLIPRWIGAVFDPWAWVTVLRVPATEAQAAYFDRHLISKVDYLTREGIRVWIRRTGYINVNTQEDLARAQLLEDHEAH